MRILSKRRDYIAPEIDCAFSLVCFISVILFASMYLTDNRDLAAVVGIFIFAPAGLFSLYLGMTGLLDNWSGQAEELGGDND